MILKNNWLILFFVLLGQCSAFSGEVSGTVLFENRYYYEKGLIDDQERLGFSAAFLPLYTHSWESGRQNVSFQAFLRFDQNDEERTHADIRELAYIKALQDWEFRIGVRKVFWGVTESQHLVDVINQTDFVENIDGEDKLGQPMVNVAWVQDFGTVDFFLLPYFRERTFSDSQSRFRFALPVDTDGETYESRLEQKRVDWAVRWSHSVDLWDVAVSYFSGTSREPELRVSSDNSRLVPHYFLIEQIGVELQYTWESWLLKFESITRDAESKKNETHAFVGGFEYTFYGALGTADLGVLTEYHYDDRGLQSTTGFQNDLFIGARLAFNDTQSSEFLGGIIVDLEQNSQLFFIEASRRLNSNWKLSLEARGFLNVADNDVFFSVRKDSYLQAELEWFF